MSNLGAQRMLTPSGITRVVIRLEERGLVRREPDPADGRAAFAVLTKPGLEALRRAQVIHHATVRELYVGRLTQHELDRLAAALREGATGRRQRFRLAAAADERLAPAKPFSLAATQLAGAKQGRVRQCCSYVNSGSFFSVLKTVRASCRLRQRSASRRLFPSLCLRSRKARAGGWTSGLGDCDAMEGAVELAVAAAVEAMARSLAGARFERWDGGVAGELGVRAEAVDRADLAEQLRRA